VIKINEDIIKMADLLRMGYTMLNIACPICNNPIFKDKKGEKLCASCNRKVVIMKDDIGQNYVKKEEIPNHNENVSDISEKNIMNTLKTVIEKKLQLLIEKLETEIEVDLIMKYSEVLSRLFDIYKKVSL
jgi:uncharacterized Zn finger protein (UPF0148 family)